MKKNFCLVIFLLLFPLLCFSQTDFHFSLAPRISFTVGELTELLYTDNEIVSQLDWEQKPLLNLGLNASAGYKNFFISADFDYCLPAGTSYMYDSDWEGGEKYSLTKHPIESSKNIDTALSLAYQIPVSKKISIIPTLQFNYLFNDFEAGIGSGVRHGRNIRVYGIDYRRHSFFIFTGAAVKVQPFSKLFIQADFMLAPWNYQLSFDYHHGVKNPFSTKDIQFGFFSKYKAGLTTGIILDKNITLQLFAQLLFGFPDKGPIYTDYCSTTMEKSPCQKSGAATRSLKSGLAVNFSLK